MARPRQRSESLVLATADAISLARRLSAAQRSDAAGEVLKAALVRVGEADETRRNRLNCYRDVAVAAAATGCRQIAVEARAAIVELTEQSAAGAAIRAKLDFSDALALHGEPLKAAALLTETLERTELLQQPPAGLVAVLRARLGAALAAQRKTHEAMSLLEDAVLRLRRAGRSHRAELSRALMTLGAVLDLAGYSARAAAAHRESLFIFNIIHGPSPPRGMLRLKYAIIHNLSAALRRQGDSRNAARLAKDVVDYYKSNAPPHDPARQYAIINHAQCLCDLGDRDAARVDLQELLKYHQAIPASARTRELAWVRLHLACTLSDAGDATLAGACADEAAREIQSAETSDSPSRAFATLVQGGLVRAAGDAVRARSLLESVPLQSSAADAGVYYELGVCYRNTGQLEKAVAALEKAREILKQCLPADHPEYLRCVRELCLLHAQSGNAGGLTEGLGTIIQQLGFRLRAAARLGARDAEVVARASGPELFDLIAMDFRRPASPDYVEPIFELIELRRALASRQQFHAGAMRSAAPSRARARAAEARRHLAELASRLRDRSAPMPTPAELLQSVRDRNEADAWIEKIHQKHGSRPVAFDGASVAARLNPGSAAITFIQFHDALSGAAGLAAHVLVKNRPVVRVDIGDFNHIRDAVLAWRPALSAQPGGTARGIGGLEVHGSAGGGDAGARLRSLLFDPLKPLLKDIRKLHICPDDVLHLVPLDMIPVEGGRLFDLYDCTIAPSLAVLDSARRTSAKRGRALVIGGLHFGARRRNASVHSLAPLPETRVEARAVAKLLKTERSAATVLLTGKNGTKDAFQRSARSAGWIHIATHAYYLNSDPPVPSEDRAPLVAPDLERLWSQLSPFSLSGIAFAGANRGPDGILTSEELAAMKLQHRSIVILSACDTAAGPVVAGCGVASLREAAHAAGAGITVTNLWKVTDRASREFIILFYRELLRRLPAPAALAAAKRAFAERGAPPADYAGWVVSGG